MNETKLLGEKPMLQHIELSKPNKHDTKIHGCSNTTYVETDGMLQCFACSKMLNAKCKQ